MEGPAKLYDLAVRLVTSYNNFIPQRLTEAFEKSPEYLFQVVAGINYEVEYKIKETNCSKHEYQDLHAECKPIFGVVSNLHVQLNIHVRK